MSSKLLLALLAVTAAFYTTNAQTTDENHWYCSTTPLTGGSSIDPTTSDFCLEPDGTDTLYGQCSTTSPDTKERFVTCVRLTIDDATNTPISSAIVADSECEVDFPKPPLTVSVPAGVCGGSTPPVTDPTNNSTNGTNSTGGSTRITRVTNVNISDISSRNTVVLIGDGQNTTAIVPNGPGGGPGGVLPFEALFGGVAAAVDGLIRGGLGL